MSNITNPNIDRRQFLIGAATVAGVVTLGVASGDFSAAIATVTSDTKKQPSIAFWDGKRLVAANRLPSGDVDLVESTVNLKIHSSAADFPSIRAIDIHYPTVVSETQHYAPYQAWTRKQHASTTAKANVPVTEDGIELVVHHKEERTEIQLRVAGNTGRPKLCVGTYILSANIESWAMYHYHEATTPGTPGCLVRRSLSGFVPVTDEYITIQVEKA